MAITLEARNYRVLRNTTWSPSGVCVVVGANGSGKTTLLSVFEFLRNAYRRGLPAAIDSQGGAWGLRHWQAHREDILAVGVRVDGLLWELRLSTRGATVDPHPGEWVTRGNHPAFNESLLSREPFSDKVHSKLDSGSLTSENDRLALRVVYESTQAPELRPLVDAIEAFRFYRSYNLFGLRRNGSLHGSDLYLNPSGENALTVLRNWRDRREYQEKYRFVLDGLRSAFPEFFDDIEFVGAGQTVSVNLFPPKADQSVPLYFAPNGWLTGLLHLCAVAGAQPGSLIAIDEMENTLHPFAIRQLTAAFREWADEHDLTVCLASHSPVLLDEFREEHHRVFVMEHGQPSLPVPLTDLRDKEWLAQFSLGRLYEHGEFGGQRADAAPASAG